MQAKTEALIRDLATKRDVFDQMAEAQDGETFGRDDPVLLADLSALAILHC